MLCWRWKLDKHCQLSNTPEPRPHLMRSPEYIQGWFYDIAELRHWRKAGQTGRERHYTEDSVKRGKSRKRNLPRKARGANHSWPCSLRPRGTRVFSSKKKMELIILLPSMC